MSRATGVIREAMASTAARRSGPALAGPSTYIQGYQAPKKEKSPVNYLVLHDVPRTASHKDVLRALEQRSIVTKDFPLSSITMPPPSFPRLPTQTKSVHLTLNRDRTVADHAVRTIRKSPLFPDLTPTERRPSFNCGMLPGAPVMRTSKTAHDWVSEFIRTMPTPRRVSSLPRIPDASGGEAKGKNGWDAAESTAALDKPDVEWCMDTRHRGRRVVIKGLPGSVDHRNVRLLADDCGVDQRRSGNAESDDVKRIPQTVGSYTSTWVVTTDSVTNACRLVRKLNRQYYNKARHSAKYPLRAEIAW